MNNKGFTIIEIICVVAVMAVVGVVATFSLTSTLEETRTKNCDDFVLEIEQSACTYIELNSSVNCNRTSGCTVNLGTLIDNGYIKEEKDPCTNKTLTKTSTISITFPSGQKKCRYNGVRVYGG